MKLQLLVVGKTNEFWLNELEKNYQSKINKIIRFAVKTIKNSPLPRPRASEKIQDEQKKILAAISEDDFVILFDEKGKNFDSVTFSKVIGQQLENGYSVVFVIGGAFGVGESVEKRANLKVSLSHLTINHLIARAVVLEQIYRSLTIWKRIPYHN